MQTGFFPIDFLPNRGYVPITMLRAWFGGEAFHCWFFALFFSLAAIFPAFSAAEVIPNDLHFGKQWALSNDGTFSEDGVVAKAGADLKMPQAWEIQEGDSSIIVAILDTGIKPNHEEFKGRIWINKGEIPGNGIDDDGNGFIDDVQGWDFVDNDNDPSDTHGHGLEMATIIGSNGNNQIGYAGVDWQCKLMILRTGENENGKNLALAQGINYAVTNGANAINISSASSQAFEAVRESVENAYSNGVVVISGMGNDGREEVKYPAAYPSVIAVGATNPDDRRSATFFWGGGSNFGEHIDLCAPGNFIYVLDIFTATEYSYEVAGTSASTAFVSGVAALLLAQNPNRTPDEIFQILTQSADDQVGDPSEDTQGWDKYHGWGRVNAFRALTYNPETIRIGNYHRKQIFASRNSRSIVFRFPLSMSVPPMPSISLHDIQGRAFRFRITPQTSENAIIIEPLQPLPAGIIVKAHWNDFSFAGFLP